MVFYIFKLLVTVLLVVLVSELAKRSTLYGALLASVPLVSVLAMIWLFVDTRDTERVAALSGSILWLVLPSLALFIVLPVLLKAGVNFYLSMAIGVAITMFCYWLAITFLPQFGIKL
ncbi:MAG: DUF3147 family protein [Betaproteobacteria bacterium]|nr:MAG: DUF3147 family protein [Betaproteobacteria bacterium]